MANERNGGNSNRGNGGSEQEQHLRGVSDKEQRMYEHIKEGYQERGVSTDEAEERAARTVNKTRREHGETKSSKSSKSKSSSGTGKPKVATLPTSGSAKLVDFLAQARKGGQK